MGAPPRRILAAPPWCPTADARKTSATTDSASRPIPRARCFLKHPCSDQAHRHALCIQHQHVFDQRTPCRQRIFWFSV